MASSVDHLSSRTPPPPAAAAPVNHVVDREWPWPWSPPPREIDDGCGCCCVARMHCTCTGGWPGAGGDCVFVCVRGARTGRETARGGGVAVVVLQGWGRAGGGMSGSGCARSGRRLTLSLEHVRWRSPEGGGPSCCHSLALLFHKPIIDANTHDTRTFIPMSMHIHILPL